VNDTATRLIGGVLRAAAGVVKRDSALTAEYADPDRG
jgi:hypothetical protein